jgi:hypothetical protein
VRNPNGTTPSALAKADILRGYELSEILQLKFIPQDQYHQGTILNWVHNDAHQLRDYINSQEVKKLMENGGLELRAHLVIIVGSRHILLWDMNEDGNLTNEPRLVGMTST